MKTIQTLAEYSAIPKEGKHIITFGAAWCGPCKSMVPVFKTACEEDSSVSIYKIDIDAFFELAMSHNVTTVPTTLFFVNGVQTKRVVGPFTKQLIKDFYNETTQTTN